MAYNESLAARVRKQLARRQGLAEKKMFGGIAFLLRGHRCCGVLNDNLVVRVGAERYHAALAQPHARPMDFTGRSLKGFLYVGPGGCRTDKDLRAWLRQAIAFARSLKKKPL